MPYDRFAVMQLAGDILEPESLEAAAATGFLVAGTHNTVVGSNSAMKLAARHDELEELAGTVGQTFLGMTVNCARCHDHKFDPITAREYYNFVSALDGIQHGERRFSARPESSALQQQIADQRDAVQNQLTEMLLARGGVISATANILSTRTPFDANREGHTYRVTLKIAPSVWAAASQATSGRDGVTVSILRNDGLTVARASLRPGAWNGGEKAGHYRTESFEYNGDGGGPVRIQLSTIPLHSGRFGGAVDDLSVVHTDSGKSVFADSFDDLQQQNTPGMQADTGRSVFFGAASERWKHSGTNTIHAVEHSDGNLAIQLFSGNGGIAAIAAETPEEQRLRAELTALEDRIDGLSRRDVYTVVAGRPSVMHVYQRGDVRRPGEQVAPGGLAALSSLPASFGIEKDAPDSQRRLQLARWTTHRDNPLFHRVAVNRIWHYHFGRGLVTSPSDFGFNGSRPSHPELLDWLSIWFRDHKYSMKALHRLIVTSATYQQASGSRPSAERSDSSNRLLWRQNARRLEAEVLRDSILEIAGRLDRRQFGPGYRDVEVHEVPPAFYYLPLDPIGTEFNRRTVYRWNVRGQRSALLDTFDCPDPSTKTPVRLVTTTPSQALSQWNDRFITRMADHLAARIQEAGGDDVDQQATLAWRHTLGRPPDRR